MCSCAIVTNGRLLFILACGSQQPPHIRCEIGGEEEGFGKGEGVDGVTVSKHFSLKAANLCFRIKETPSQLFQPGLAALLSSVLLLFAVKQSSASPHRLRLLFEICPAGSNLSSSLYWTIVVSVILEKGSLLCKIIFKYIYFPFCS